MPTPRVLILRAPGTNCDQETAFAFEQAGGATSLVHINRLLEQPKWIDAFQILCLPGGFSYGDDIAAGRILANQIQHHLRDAILAFKAAGKLVLGICNGFQVLLRSGILLEEDERGALATLTGNDSGKFEDRWVQLDVAAPDCVFLRGISSMYLPVAHAEGKFVTRDAAVLDALAAQGQLVLRYGTAASRGNGQAPYPANPNGSQADVAGISDPSGRVFGLMPHPERHIDPTQHPRWMRGPLPEKGDGFAVFDNAVRFFAG
ncbi:MAG: phosphoribosylformylglycinamidine synthase I [Pirellulaceae bacterium]